MVSRVGRRTGQAYRLSNERRAGWLQPRNGLWVIKGKSAGHCAKAHED